MCNHELVRIHKFFPPDGNSRTFVIIRGLHLNAQLENMQSVVINIFRTQITRMSRMFLLCPTGRNLLKIFGKIFGA